MKLVATDLCVNRGFKRIVQDVSFELGRGDLLVVTGDNGAGKSTLLRAICGLLPISEGNLELIGGSIETPLCESIHYLGPLNAMKSALSVRDNFSFWQDFCTSDVAPIGLSIEEALAKVELAHVVDLPFGVLSTGMKRRVAIARLLLIENPIWVVDEPTSGLDEASSKLFANIVREYCKSGGIVIAATHRSLGIKSTKSVELKQLYTFFEGDEFFDDAPEFGDGVLR